MDYNSATHCGYCGKDCTHTDGRLLDFGKVFCNLTCNYFYVQNLELLNQEVKDDKPTSSNS